MKDQRPPTTSSPPDAVDAIREKCSAQVMGLQPVEWQDPVIDEPKLRAARSGRLGFTFVVIAMRCRLGV